ncbi:YggT family protein [Candidatus Hepatincola sp. Pdp]
MDIIILRDILKGIIALANFYLFLMFIMAILSLLGTFGIINLFDGPLSRIFFTLKIIIDPATNFIARFVPRVGMLDLSFLVLVIILWIVIDICEYWLSTLAINNFTF